MASLLVRNLEEGLVRQLKMRAASHGRSAEAEHREILRAAPPARESDFGRRAAALRRRTAKRHQTPSEQVLRELRRERLEQR